MDFDSLEDAQSHLGTGTVIMMDKSTDIVAAIVRSITINRNLFHTITKEGSNILEHLTKMKEYFECINMFGDKDFLITNHFLKVVLISLLLPSWDTFTDPYLGGWKGVVETDPKKLMLSQELISILKEEYLRHQVCIANSVNLVTQQKPNLAKHMGIDNDNQSM